MGSGLHSPTNASRRTSLPPPPPQASSTCQWASPVFFNTIQYNTIQYNTIQYNTIQYNTIQLVYFTTLATSSFYYASHTQKLVSRWGAGKHITIKYVYICMYICIKIKKLLYMESVRSSRRHGRRGGKFVFKIRKRLCGLCLIGKIVPKHCTTILKAALQKISCVYGLGSVRSVSIFLRL